MLVPRYSRRDLMRGAVMLGAGAAVGGTGWLAPSGASAAVPSPGIAGTAAWGARAPDALSVIGSNPNKILVHHTASPNSTDYSLAHAYALARSIQADHMDRNGWPDSGQHFTISRGGYVMEGRHHSLARLNAGSGMVIGTHCPGQNDQAIGIENEGTYISVGPTGALYNKLVALCAYICDQYGIAASQIYGHRDFRATECPGDVLYAMLPQLRRDVADALAGRRHGTTTVGWYRNSDSSFHLTNSPTGGASDLAFVFGPANTGGIVPITGDWNGDGITTVGWYRRSDSSFHLTNSPTGGASDYAFVYGPPNTGGIVPVTGDWNGDGTTTVGWYRNSDSSFHLTNSHGGGTSDLAFVYGPANSGGIVPVTGDWNGA